MKNISLNCQIECGKISIGAWVSPTPAAEGRENCIKPESFMTAAELGLDMVYGLYEQYPNDKDLIKDALDYCELAGIKYLVNFPMLGDENSEIDNINKNIFSFINHKAFSGFVVRDEPGTKSFGFLRRVLKELKRVYGKDKLYLINMLPDYAPVPFLINGMWTREDAKVGAYSYERYIEDYIDIVNPDVFSYDYYPFRGEFPQILDSYFTNLSTVRKYCTKYGKPLWVFIQSISRNNVYRHPSKEEIFWQVSTSFVYGAKGIQYFCFWTPFDSKECSFNNAIIAPDGTRTELFGYVKDINLQLKAMEDDFHDAGFIGIIDNKKGAMKVPEEDILINYEGILRLDGGSALAGCFKFEDGKSGIYIMNNKITEGTEEISVVFNCTKSLAIIEKGKRRAVSADCLKFSLEGGEGVFIKY